MTNPMPFSLRFPLTEIDHWASRYVYEEDDSNLAISNEVQKRGHYTREEFLALAKWRALRSVPKCEKNESGQIEYATRIALTRENKFERLRIGILNSLQGVNWPMASVLLHFGHRDPYPILDFRALWSLGLEEGPSEYNFKFGWDYVEDCCDLREKAGTTMRTVDRALWQYSKEH
jgi:hypothetical protein